jgi:hypothetical protein
MCYSWNIGHLQKLTCSCHVLQLKHWSLMTNVSAIAHDKNKLVFVGDQCFSYSTWQEQVSFCKWPMLQSGETLLCVALMMYHYKHPTGRVCLDYKTSIWKQIKQKHLLVDKNKLVFVSDQCFSYSTWQEQVSFCKWPMFQL